jgi:hypothetical protein
MRRFVRLFIVLLAAAATAAAAWRATTNEQVRATTRQQVQTIDRSAEQGLLALADLRATLYAYVAPGQGRDFWTTRAAAQLDEVRRQVIDLDRATAAAGHPLAETLDAIDRLASLERRAREHVDAGQPLLAGDVIFADARGIVDGIAEAMALARQAAVGLASSGEAAIAQEQSLLAGGVLAAWIVATIGLVPVPRSTPTIQPPLDAGRVLGLTAAPPTRSERAVTTTPAVPAVPDATAETPRKEFGVPDLTALAVLCADLGRVSDAAELGPLLDRAGRLLDASGVIVWVVTPDAAALMPAASCGFDERTLERIGPIPLSADNLTATAFHQTAPLTRASTDDASGGVAVPLVSGSGPVGVLSVEVRPGVDARFAAALAGVIAAPLAALLPAPPAGTAESSPLPRRA